MKEKSRELQRRIKRVGRFNKRETLYREATKQLLSIVATLAKGVDEEKILFVDGYDEVFLKALEAGNEPIMALLREVGAIDLGEELGTVAMA